MSTSTSRVDLFDLSRDEVVAFLHRLGQPSYRAAQLLSWLHRGTALAEMTDLPAALRDQLIELARAGSLSPSFCHEAPDGTAKFGFEAHDGHTIETVLIPHPGRITVCLSSQVGCAFGCSFCATGQHGLTRDLTAGEIVEQAVRVQQAARPNRVRNVVFMGMGEPLANYEAVLKAVRLLHAREGPGIGARHIAISTCGLPGGIRRLAGEGLQLGLAVSLHGATDEVRDQIVPLNRRHPLAEVMAATRLYFQETGRKVSLQYVAVPGLNDTPEQARALAKMTRGLPSVVNLIPRNPADGAISAEVGPAHRFAARLRRHGIETAVRRSRGAEVLGACGQLRPRPSRQKSDAGRPARAIGH